MTRRAILWTISALLGIVATAAVAWAASQLAGQHIGLTAAPLSVQRGLAPPARKTWAGADSPHRGRRRQPEPPSRRSRPSSPSKTVIAPTTVTTPGSGQVGDDGGGAPPQGAGSSGSPQGGGSSGGPDD